MIIPIPLVLAALAILSPKDGSVVPTLKDGQKAYFDGLRAERIMRMENPADRAKLLAMGSRQKPLKLEWSGDTNAVYLLSIVRTGGEPQLFAISNRTDAYITNLELGSRFDWSVRQAGSLDSASASFTTEATAPRLLRAGGVSNFRDLGGWAAAGGKRVRQNRIFRSAGLRSSSKSRGTMFKGKIELGERRVSDAGIVTLREDFKIKTDFELRSTRETAGMYDSVLGADVQWEGVPFAAYDLIDNAVRGREPFAKIFGVFTKEENYPILFHCSGGRDRTGTLAFLLNGLLGVSEEDLCRDWEASIFSTEAHSFKFDVLQRLLDYLKTQPGDTITERIESYARGCGITDEEIAAFRALMLE